MIILLICVYSSKAPFAVILFMMATPPCCASSFPTYTTFSPLCSVTVPTFSIWSHLSLALQSHTLSSLQLLALPVFSQPWSLRSRSQWSSVAWRLLWVPFILWVSSWLWPNSVIAAPAAIPRVTVVSSPTLLVSLTVFIRWGRKLYDQTPTLRTRCGITVCPVSTLWPFRHGWPYQEYKTPADIALGVMETCKLPYHEKVVTPFGAETLEFWPYLYKHWNSGPVLINIGILILSFHYKHWNSDLILPNIEIFGPFL